MKKGNNSSKNSPTQLSQGQKSREQECQNCELGIKVENCRKCVFDILTTAEVDNWNERVLRDK